MRLPRTEVVVPRVVWLEHTASTNTALRDLVATEGAEHGTLVATADQTAGRGRLGRTWVTPAGTSLAVSMLVREAGARLPALPTTPGQLSPSWLPLIAGSAVAATLQTFFAAGQRVGVKWPNDVHVRDEADAAAGRIGGKLCGILCEMLDDGSVIVGMGINVLVREEDLPTDRATSLLVAGADVSSHHGAVQNLSDTGGAELADKLLSTLAAELLRLARLAHTDARTVRARVLRHSLTIGEQVRVHIVGEAPIDGRAVALGNDGELVVDLPTGGQLTVSAADVEHLR